MGKSTALSLDWSYDTILFFLALHSAVSALALIVFNKGNYIQKSIEKIRHSSRNIIIKRKLIHLIFNLNIFVIFLLPAAFYIAGNFEILDHDLKDLENHNPPIPINKTIKIRKTIAVGRIISIIDAIINLWGSYISACALTVYLLANRAICRQYHSFNKILKSHIIDGSIMNYQVIKEHESQIIDFMSSACYITNTTAFLINLTFMTGILAQISAQFALRAFSLRILAQISAQFALRAFSLSAIENVIFGIWTAQSIVLLVVSTKRPAILQSLLNETIEMIWLDQGIWETCDDLLIRETARNISDRIGSVDYASKGLTPTRASNLVFNAVLLIIPFFIDIVAANKYLPNVIKKSA
uniref:Gustatory receptor n=1 Tax=Panagrolaimus sp. PS1159 TaxID=55785 RepID=A0AC35F7A5_9BILA